MELYIIRHGQSIDNANAGSGEYILDPPLTDTGHRQAERLARHFARLHEADGSGFTHLYASPLRRALQTMQPIAGALGMAPEVWVDIHEWGGAVAYQDGVLSNGPGLTRCEMQAEFSGFVLPDTVTDAGWWHRDGGMESVPECYLRGQKVAAALRERGMENTGGKDERIILVTHGVFANGLIRCLFNMPFDQDHYLMHHNTGVTRVICGASTVLFYLNRTDHLPDDLMTY